MLSEYELHCLSSLGIDVIDPNRNYWLVRTDGGEYFEEFFFGNYIGIQWNEIRFPRGTAPDLIEKEVSICYPDEARPGYVANQIHKFISEFKKGDIVLIPSKNSKHLAFGELLEDDFYYADDPVAESVFDELLGSDSAPSVTYNKRRKVRWLTTRPRANLDPYLQTFIYAHNTIVDLNSYALFIDRTLSDFYVKDSECYFSFMVNKRERIPFGKMYHFLSTNQLVMNYINSHFQSFSAAEAILLDDFTVKINVQSKGPIQLIGPMKKALAFGLVTIALMGGTLKFSFSETEFEFNSDGILPILQEIHTWYNDFIEREAKSDDEQRIENAISESQQDIELALPELPSGD